MTTNIEIEFKCLLNESNFYKLIDFLDCKTINPIIQVNTYYDTTDCQLEKLKSALRTRNKDNKNEMTLKTPLEQGILETEQKLTQLEAENLTSNFPDGPVKNKLKELNIDFNKFINIGSIKTKRIEVNYKACLICLDKSSYKGVTDYEIELETSDYDYGYKVFLDLLESLSIPYKKALPKVVRAIQI